MNRVLLSMLLLLAGLDNSLLFAETYQWTDASGTVHFSDNPPSGKKAIVKHDDINVMPSISSEKPSTTTSAGKRQPSKEPSWKPDASCIQEMKAYEKNLKQKTEIATKCVDSVARKSRQVYSPECFKQIESKEFFPLTAACQQEVQKFSQAMMTGHQQCNKNIGTGPTLSTNCIEQMERYKKSGHVWSDLFQ